MAIIPVRNLKKYINTTPSRFETLIIDESIGASINLEKAQGDELEDNSNWGFIGSYGRLAGITTLKLLEIHPDVCIISITDGSDYPAFLIKLFTLEHFRFICEEFHVLIYNQITNGEDISDIIRVSSNIWLKKILKAQKKEDVKKAILFSCHYADKKYYNYLKHVWNNCSHIIVGNDTMNDMYDAMRDSYNYIYDEAKAKNIVQEYLKREYDRRELRNNKDNCDIYYNDVINNSDYIIDTLLSKMGLDKSIYDFDKAIKIIKDIDLYRWKTDSDLIKFHESIS